MGGCDGFVFPPPVPERQLRAFCSQKVASCLRLYAGDFAPAELLSLSAMKILLSCGVLILATGIHLYAADFYAADRYRGDPNHLVPRRGEGEYEQCLAKYLFLTDGDFGRMLVRPSFKPEFCLSVHASIPASAIEKHREKIMVPDEEKTYLLTLTSASVSIWDSLGRTNEVKVSRTDRPISLELAVAIQRVWGKVLHLTRYAPGPKGGYDGVTYDFSVWVRGLGELQGQTWGPVRELPTALVSVGTDLIAFVSQDAKGKLSTERELIRKLKKIEAKIPGA
jgi:hypothetical protein